MDAPQPKNPSFLILQTYAIFPNASQIARYKKSKKCIPSIWKFKLSNAVTIKEVIPVIPKSVVQIFQLVFRYEKYCPTAINNIMGMAIHS